MSSSETNPCELRAELEGLRRLMIAKFEAADRAVLTVEASHDRRFESVNEFRAQLSDQVATFLPRAEYQVQHISLSDKLDRIDRDVRELRESRSAGEGRRTQLEWLWPAMVGLGLLAMSVATYLKH